MIGNRIRTAREQLGLSLEDVAEKVGVSHQSVQQWETGKSAPHRKRMIKLAAVLGRSPSWIQFGIDSDSPMTTDDFIKTPEFMVLMRGAFIESVKMSIAMQWLSEGKKKITFDNLADVFETKASEALFIDKAKDDDIADKEAL